MLYRHLFHSLIQIIQKLRSVPSLSLFERFDCNCLRTCKNRSPAQEGAPRKEYRVARLVLCLKVNTSTGLVKKCENWQPLTP